ncbi:MAG: ABC transporter substrate-binding protein [Pseudomonadota bacterium]
MRILKNVIRVAAVVAALVVSPAQAEVDAPDTVIRGAAEALASALRDDRETLETDSDALYQLINSILEPRFDQKYAAQLVLGRSWRTASDAQKTAFIDAFYNTMLRRYADGVLQFDEERMTVLPYKPGKQGKKKNPRTKVKTSVVLDDGTEVPVDYGLVLRADGWKVYDVVIEGISYVRNFRTELNAEVTAKGLDAVIARLQSEAGMSAAEPATAL